MSQTKQHSIYISIWTVFIILNNFNGFKVILGLHLSDRLKIIAIIIVTAIYLLYTYFSIKSEIKSKQKAISKLLEFAKLPFPYNKKYRVNLMVPVKKWSLSLRNFQFKETYLKVKYKSSNMIQADKNLELEKGEGLVWRVFEDKATYWININEVNLEEEYNLGSITQNLIWKDMKSLLSLPVLDQDSNVVGILNLDTSIEYQKSHFDESFYQDHVIHIANQLEHYSIYF